MNSIFKRTSVRTFLDRPVEPEKIEKLLRAAMAAPSARNQQPWEFYVVTDRQKRQEISSATPYAGPAALAPLVIVPCYRKVSFLRHMRLIDLSAATENILLEAMELGLGGVWIGIAPVEERMSSLRRILPVADHLEPFAMLPIGYPTDARTQQDRYDASRVHYV